MKILFANKFFFLNGGSETVFFQERDFLTGQGHTVLDFSMKDERNLLSPCSDFFVPHISYNSDGGIVKKIKQAAAFIHSSVAIKKLETLLIQEKPDIAHLHNIYHQLTPSIIPLLKKYGVKVVLTLHDYKLVCPSYLALKNEKICNDCAGKYFWKPITQNCQNSRMKGLLLSLEAIFHTWKGSYDGVDLFLAPSAFMANLIARRIPEGKIMVLRNGIDVATFQPSFSNKGYGLYFGRLSREKGVKTLLQAYGKMRCDCPLKIVGTGPLSNELHQQYSDVEFLGYQSGQELNTTITGAAFVVVPSEWYENCSMVVLEAMALGKPVIGSRVGGIPEQIEEGKTGFLFAMGNADELKEKMTALINNPELCNVMGRAARQKLEDEYSLETHCQKLLNIYSQLLLS